MSEPALTVDVQAGDGAMLPLPAERVEAAVKHVLAAEKVERAEISVTLLTDQAIAEMNTRYLRHEGATDVISFPLEAPAGILTGDVYVGADQARRQAEELAIPVAEEVLRLAIHGVLHVLGYDHPDSGDRESSPMYQRQETLLRSFLEAEVE